MKINESTTTPLHKILLALSFCFFLLFGSFYLLVKDRNNILEKNYQLLIGSGSPVFATLTEYHPVLRDGKKDHVYTYLVPDEMGKLHEITESVDNVTNRKLRIGDTVITKRKTIQIYGKEYVISRIEGNQENFPNFKLLENLAISGFCLGGMFFLSAIYHKFK
ncbi:MAG: hypothetical protein K8R21_00770 [Leptospira sp.]|nr:hypothetical protein [Leptospira sp.]